MGHRRAPLRRGLALLLVATAAAVSLLAPTAVSADVTITSQPPLVVSNPVGATTTVSVAAASAAGAALTYRWQSRWSYAPPTSWTDVPGATEPTLSRPMDCTTYGFTQSYRAVVRGAPGSAAVTSAPSQFVPVLLPGRVVSAPPAEVVVLAGGAATLTWAVAHDRPPWMATVRAEARGRRGEDGDGGGGEGPVLPPGASQTSGRSGDPPVWTATLTIPAVTGALDGTRYGVTYVAYCGGNHGMRSEAGVSATVTLRVRTGAATCPPRVRAVAADYAGRVVTAGDANRQPSCGACADSCAATPLCDTWVYGSDPRVAARHRQCWLKRSAAGGPPVAKPPPTTTPDAGWVSGVIPAPAACPDGAAVGVDLDGEVLVRGDAGPPVGSCRDCAAACARTPACGVWVYGWDRGSERAGECWLKRGPRAGAPAVKPWGGGRVSPWVSGVRTAG